MLIEKPPVGSEIEDDFFVRVDEFLGVSHRLNLLFPEDSVKIIVRKISFGIHLVAQGTKALPLGVARS